LSGYLLFFAVRFAYDTQYLILEDWMMIKSMTAFARVSESYEGGELVWELRSVNQRFLNIHIHLPDAYRHLEPDVRRAIKTHMARGTVEVRLTLGQDSGDGVSLDEGTLERLARLFAKVNPLFSNQLHVDFSQLLSLLKGKVVVTSDDAVLALLDTGLTRLDASRNSEGAHLLGFIEKRLAMMAPLHQQIKTLTPILQQRQQEKLTTLAKRINLDRERLEQEVALLLQKIDVEEEISRIGFHLAELQAIVQRTEPVGRRLDFVLQELQREVNTFSTKCQHVDASAVAVEMKVVIEQMREQVQNIE
jgi:uncharacterized protein (TIGR00255 family)